MALWGGNYVAGSARPRCFWRLGATGRWVWGHRISSKTPRSEWHRFWCAGLRTPGRFFARWMTRGSLRMPGRLSARLAAGMAMLAGVGLVICGALLLIGADLVPAVQAIDANDETIFAGRERYISLATADAEMLYTPGVSGATVQTATNLTLTANAGTDVNLTLAMADDTTSLARSGSTDSLYQIAATTKTAALNDFDANTWGYSLDGTTFQAVPTPGEGADLIYTLPGSDTGESTQTLTVHYGMKLDGTLPAGQYTNRVVYAATAAEVIPEASLESVVFAGAPSDTLYTVKDNVLTVRINLAPQPPYGTPRVYYVTDSGVRQECASVTTSTGANGLIEVVCTVAPSESASSATLYIVTKGGGNDPFCAEGSTSDCAAGDWHWGDYSVELPEIKRLIFDGIVNMQEMNAGICSRAVVGDTKRLVDTRDGQPYWVAKLADNNCWMTQNLNLNLSGRTLTPADSDVDENWTFNGNVYTSASDGEDGGILLRFDRVQMWDLGEYVQTNPRSASSCGSSGTINNLGNCPNQFTNVAGMTAMTEISDAVIAGNSYDAHYLAGKYYSRPAALAGSGGGVEVNTPGESICAAGWHLPNNNNDEWNALINAYGLGSLSVGNNDVALAPIYLVRAGYVDAGERLTNAGYYGRYWLAQTSGLTWSGHMFSFDDATASTGGTEQRYNGDTVRCVANQ